MKKLFLLLVTIGITQLCYPQSKWSMGISVQPGVSNLINPTSPVFADTINISTAAKLSYSLGLFIRYDIDDRFHLRWGINYSQMGFNWTSDKSYYSPQLIEAMNAAFPELGNWESTRVSANYRFIEMPISLYHIVFSNDAIELYLSGGGCLSYLYDGNWELVANYTNHNDKTNHNENPTINDWRLRFGAQVGLGVSYNVTNRSKLFIEPSCHQLIGKIKNTFPLDGAPYTLGVNMGIIYKM